ncbi:MAG: hypothetical protein ABSF83_07360 [Nitrososphaerales archaeon]
MAIPLEQRRLRLQGSTGSEVQNAERWFAGGALAPSSPSTATAFLTT